MKTLILFIAFFVSKNLLCQNTYSVYYTHEYPANVSIDGTASTYKMDSRLVFNDSLSFFYFIQSRKKDNLRKANKIGDKLIHHALFYNRNIDELLAEATWPKDTYCLLKIEQPLYNWTFTKETKSILGYNCNQALSVNEEGDTTFVWYTNQINNIFGPMYYFGLPGIVLEVNNYKGSGSLIKVKSIQLIQATLVKPDAEIPKCRK